MGQDRKFSERQKVFALRAVQHFRDRWEEQEKDNLRSDIQAQVDRSEHKRIHKESREGQDQQELERKVEEATSAAAPAEGDEPLT